MRTAEQIQAEFTQTAADLGQASFHVMRLGQHIEALKAKLDALDQEFAKATAPAQETKPIAPEATANPKKAKASPKSAKPAAPKTTKRKK
jgi:chromosome segregation ATPase